MAFNIPAGKLKHVITLQSRVDTVDADYGGSRKTWVDFATVRAEKTPFTGHQIMAAKAVQSEAKVRFRFRRVDGVEPTMEIVEGGVRYKIVSDPVDILGEGRWIEVLATSIVGGS